MSKILQGLAWILLGVGAVIIIYFLIKSASDGYGISLKHFTNYETSGEFGDFVGGVVGTLFTLAGTLLIFLSFWEQNKQNKREEFESSYFEMIRLHRENVSELKYIKYKNKKEFTYENRQVIRVIFSEFIECYRDVKKFSNSTNPDDYIKKEYQVKLKEIIKSINPQINIIELSIIDIAYNIVFFGLSTEGVSILRKNFSKKYNSQYYYRLIYYIKLKPKKENKKRYKLWKTLRAFELVKLRELIDELYAARNNPTKIDKLSDLGKSLNMQKNHSKYYGGHQFRLGHYFRHLFQSFKYLDFEIDLKEDEKYSYAKMLRAQLSTYEQALLFINSISTLGMRWEYTSDSNTKKTQIKLDLITKYNLIKNLPGDHIYGIKYKTYYRNVEYESDEISSF